VESDRFLVRRARGGDAGAFAVLLARHRPRLARAAGSPDVAQEAALIAWLQLDRLRDPDAFGAWLAGIGRVLWLRERRLVRDELTRDGAVPDRAADPREEPAERVLAGERAAELAGAIGSLPAGQRDAVVLFHLAGLPQAAVADRLGTGGGAISTRLHKARATLRARLTPPEETRMLAATLADVRRTPAGRHVVLLAAGDDRLPIWIGRPEAEALVAGRHAVELPRPSTHALALSLVKASGRAVAAVRVVKLDASTFYAEVGLDDGSAVDARPSDALVLAVATGAPVEIDPAVLEAARSSAPDEYTEDLDASEVGGDEIAAEIREALAQRAF
jgi:RNA polymerase sigma factor (sigma-70 family)